MDQCRLDGQRYRIKARPESLQLKSLGNFVGRSTRGDGESPFDLVAVVSDLGRDLLRVLTILHRLGDQP